MIGLLILISYVRMIHGPDISIAAKSHCCSLLFSSKFSVMLFVFGRVSDIGVGVSEISKHISSE